jgi:hypothetical protein
MELIRTEDISNYCRQTTANESLKAKILADVDSFIVRKNLGAKFYTELVADCDSNDYSYTKYAPFMEGTNYNDECGNLMYMNGLKKCIAYYCYSRICRESVLESTKYGMVQKSGDYSVAPSKAQIDALSDSYKGMADEMLKECIDYALLCKKNGDSLFENVLNGNRNTNITDYIIINKIGE